MFIALVAAISAEKDSKTVTFTCEEHYTMVGTDCYFTSPDTHTGSTAQHYCTIRGGNAAIIESQEEMDLLKETLLDSTVYLGINMQDYRRYQISAALKIAGHTGFTAFGDGEPKSEDCIVADMSDSFTWKEVSCAEHHTVLCKAAATVVKEPPNCAAGQTMFENFCFWAYDNRSYTWSQAEAECMNRGLQLASIHSQEEQDFVNGLTTSSLWIGLTDLKSEGHFQWSDGTPLDFQHWDSDEPDGADNYNCVHTRNPYGYWSDYDCDNRNGVVCKGPPS